MATERARIQDTAVAALAEVIRPVAFLDLEVQLFNWAGETRDIEAIRQRVEALLHDLPAEVAVHVVGHAGGLCRDPSCSAAPQVGFREHV